MMFEKMFVKVIDVICEGEIIVKLMKEYLRFMFYLVLFFFWIVIGGFLFLGIMVVKIELMNISLIFVGVGVVIVILVYLFKMNGCVVEDLVINMVDVGEEMGEFDVMLYKVVDYYEEEVWNLIDGMMKLIELMLIIFFGFVVLFIVMVLFLLLVNMISGFFL